LSATAEVLNRFTESGDPAAFAERGLLGGAITDRAGLQRSDVPPPRSVAPPSGITKRRRLSRKPPASALLGPDSSEPELSARVAQVLEADDAASADALLAELRADDTQQALADRAM
jgi:hypothetical protein